MLEVPVKGMEHKQREEAPPPCFRCLFDKPISEGWCDPETCDMLEFWLLEKDFDWRKHENKWLMDLELKNNYNNGEKEEF